MARTYLLPQVIVQQDFESIPAEITQNLLATIVGPQKSVRQLSDADDLALVSYGDYDYTTEEEFDLKGVETLDSVEADSIKVTFGEVWAKYAEFDSSEIERGSAANLLTLAATGDGFQEYGAYDRLAVLGERDVAVGDRLKVGSVETRVTGFIHDVIPASMGTPSNDSNNPSTVALGVTTSTIDAKSTDHALVAHGTNAFLGDLEAGYITDTYTLEVTTAGAYGTAKFKVTSLEGDNEDDVTSVNFAAALTVGTKGLKLTFSGSGSFVLGEKYTAAATAAYTQHTPAIETDDYEGAYDTTYEVRVVKGGLWASEPQVVVTTNNGVDQATAQKVELNTAFRLGSLGATMEFNDSVTQDGLLLGDVYYVTATAATLGSVRTIKIADPLDDSISEGDPVDVTFSIYKESVEVPRVGYPDFSSEAWTIATDSKSVTLEDGIEVLDSTWTDSSGISLPIPVIKAKVYIEYTAIKRDNASQLLSVSDLQSVSTALGKVIPENPLAYGVYKALENSAGAKVLYAAIESDDEDGYVAAFDTIQFDPEVYYVVPLTNDTSIIQAFKAHVEAMSDPEQAQERVAIVNNPFSPVKDLYNKKEDGETSWSGYVSLESGSDPAVYNQVTVPEAQFLTDGVRAGDLFRSNFSIDAFGNDTYESFVITDVTDENSLVLESPAFETAIGSSSNLRRVQIVRNLNKEEQAEMVAAGSSALGFRRVVNVWPDRLADGSEVVPGYFGACSVAGLKSGIAPHQPVTNVTLNGFTGADRSSLYFTPSQLNKIAGGGTWIIAQERNGGEIFNRHQLTTDYSDDNMAEISITTNLDSIAKTLRTEIKEFIGRYNNHPYFLQLLRTRLEDRLTFLQGNAVTLKAGPQIIAYEITKLETDPLIRTRINVEIELTLPYPVNIISLKLVVV